MLECPGGNTQIQIMLGGGDFFFGCVYLCLYVYIHHHIQHIVMEAKGVSGSGAGKGRGTVQAI
jgi:hypothetical protein